jgi:hypothetical protein
LHILIRGDGSVNSTGQIQLLSQVVKPVTAPAETEETLTGTSLCCR